MSAMKIMTTGPAGIPGARGLEFGRGLATDDDGREHEVYNPLACPVPPEVAVVAARVHISRWVGESWCVLTIGCHVDARATGDAPGRAAGLTSGAEATAPGPMSA
jgi:hypothetical protein